MSAYLDTSVAIWLHDGVLRKISSAAKRKIDDSDLLISPIVLLEFQYLVEVGRLRMSPAEMYANLNATFGVDMCSMPFSAVSLEAVSIGWTRDPFDRLIVAQAQVNHEAALITSDELIREKYSRAVW